MDFPKAYRLADLAISQLHSRARQRADRMKRRLLIDGFDELNVMYQTESLYAGLMADNRDIWRQLYEARYEEIFYYMGKDVPEEDVLDDLVDMYLAGMLEQPSEVTHYTYSTEAIRKRDRAKEAINSVPGRVLKQTEIDKAVRIFEQMTTWYTDIVEEDSTIQALKDCGVERVLRHERNDEKCCEKCRQLDGEIYDINKIPPKPHPNCRRWFTPVGTN